MLVASNALIKVVPGLMIWTLISFGITMVVLKRYAFGPIQQMIDARRQAIVADLDAADSARNEAQEALAEYRRQLAEARKEAGKILTQDDHKRLIEDAIKELDFSALEGSQN